MERSLLISAPMFMGTSMPSRARTTVEKNVHWPHPFREEAWRAKELAAGCPLASQKRSVPSRHENHSTASTMSPCCHGLVNKLELIDCASDTTSDPDRIMT